MRKDDVDRLIEQRQALNDTPPCKTDPDAPHGFDRNASHSADRYVCECEGWEPDVNNSAHKAENVYRNVDNVNMSEKHVHKSDKSIHEPVAWLWKNIDGHQVLTDDPDYADGTWTPLYTAPPKKEWVGLTDEEIYDYADKFLYQHGSNYGIRSFGKAIEAKLKEKNT